jgi:hypothetical protein
MAEVFISYASLNREKVLEILAELQALGIDCWLDRNQIPGGSNWSQGIARGIRECRFFLLMASDESLKSENVCKELSVAAHHQKPVVPLWLVDKLTYPDHLAYHLTATQYVLATGEFATWKDRLLEALRLAGVTIPDEKTASRIEGPAAIKVATPVLPYLANRLEQERRIFNELERHLREQAHRPIAFIAHGDRNSQCLDGFVDRLSKYTLPRHFSRLNLSDQLEWKYISWPQPVSTSQMNAVDERALTYRGDVSTALDLPVSAETEAVARQITNFRKAVAFCSTIYGEHWQPDEPQLICKVLEFWSQLSPLPNNQPLIVFLAVALQQTTESRLTRWFARPQSPKIPAVVDALRKAQGIDLDIVVLPELANVSVPDIEHWVREIVRPVDSEGMIRQIKQTFKECHLAPDQAVSMEKLVPMLQAVLPSGRGV